MTKSSHSARAELQLLLSENVTLSDIDGVATYQQMTIYWCGSSVICTVGAIFVVRLLWEHAKNRAMKKDVVRVFFPMLVGNALLTLTYFVYHVDNAFRALAYPDVKVRVEHSLTCKLSWFFVSIAMHLELLGYIAISFVTFKIVMKAAEGKKTRKNAKNPLVSKVRNAVYMASAIGGLGFATYGQVDDHIGSFKGLYCSPVDFKGGYGGYIVFLIAGSFCAMGYYFFKAIVVLHFQANKTIGSRSSIDHVLKSVLKHGLMMVVSLLFTWGLFAITTVLNMAEVEVPVEATIVAGLLVKTKCTLDIHLLLHMPVVKKGRKIGSSSGTTPAGGANANGASSSVASSGTASFSTAVSEITHTKVIRL